MYHEIVWPEWTGDIGRPTIAAKLDPSTLPRWAKDPNGEGFPAPPIGRFKPETKGKWGAFEWKFFDNHVFHIRKGT